MSPITVTLRPGAGTLRDEREGGRFPGRLLLGISSISAPPAGVLLSALQPALLFRYLGTPLYLL